MDIEFDKISLLGIIIHIDYATAHLLLIILWIYSSIRYAQTLTRVKDDGFSKKLSDREDMLYSLLAAEKATEKHHKNGENSVMINEVNRDDRGESWRQHAHGEKVRNYTVFMVINGRLPDNTTIISKVQEDVTVAWSDIKYKYYLDRIKVSITDVHYLEYTFPFLLMAGVVFLTITSYFNA